MQRVRSALASCVVMAGLSALVAAAGPVVVAEGPGGSTIYAGRSPAAAALTVAAGLALVAGGMASWFGLQQRSTGLLAILAGLTWFSPAWVAYRGGSLLVPSIAMLFTGLTFPLVVHLVLAYPAGKVASLWVRGFVLVAYLEALASSIALALLRDPYFDQGCYSNCSVNVFLVRSLPSVARAIQSSDRWFVAIAASIFMFICLRRLANGSWAARRSFAPVALPAVLFAAVTVARLVKLEQVHVEDPFDDVLLAIFIAEAIALVTLGAGVFEEFVRTGSERRAVTRIVADLGEAPEPGSVQGALAAALGDPELSIAYPGSGAAGYIDALGQPIDDPFAQSARTNVRLMRDDRTVAIVSHTAAGSHLDREIGSALLLAIENEGLQAESLAELRELGASVSRIVETSDEERRRLERDLHDGAQQRLLALSYDVRRAQAAAREDGDGSTEGLLAQAVGETEHALEALRRVAHGLYPAILAEAGLGPALNTFADTAPIPIEMSNVDNERYPDAVEAAAYFAVTEAVVEATDRRAHLVTVSAKRQDGQLMLKIGDDGAERTATMIAVKDRVGAVGGTVALEPTTILVEIPCG